MPAIDAISGGGKSGLPSMDLKQFLDIDQFINNTTLSDNLGVPLVNRFVCLLNAPKFGGDSDKNGWLEFQVLSVDCPGISIETNTMDLNGVQRFNFKGRSYDDLMITFMETSELTLRNFFFQWMNKAVNVTDSGVKRSYLNDIVASNFVVAPLDFKGVVRRVDRFEKVFPIKIQDINYNYGTAGEMVKTTVTFKYMFHRIDNIDSSGRDKEHKSTQSM